MTIQFPLPSDALRAPDLPATGPRFADSHSIGRRSRALKNRHLLGRIWRVMAGVVLMIALALALGWVLGGIGFGGLFFTALASVLVAALLLRYPRLRVPMRGELVQGPLGEIVGKAELWLEARRSELPAAAGHLLDQIGIQLDSLALHLDGVGEQQPMAAEVRELVGEHLPGIVAAFPAAPQPGDEAALVDALARISAEIDVVARHLASGSTDDLALKARQLDRRSEAGALS